eukprot:2132601-Pyramimonas_sp.AAC.2
MSGHGGSRTCPVWGCVCSASPWSGHSSVKALSRSTELCVEHLAVAAGDATAVAGSRRARQSLGARRVVGALEKDEPFVVIRSFGRAGVLESMALSFFEKAAVPVFLALCPEDPSFHEYMEVCGAQGEAGRGGRPSEEARGFSGLPGGLSKAAVSRNPLGF